MFEPSAQNKDITLSLVEGGLTLIAIALAFCCPRLFPSLFSRIERAFKRLARRQTLAVASVGFAALLFRLAILPLFPIPTPFGPDDFSFLLSADTFAHGHLTNPTPAMWMHFESMHITMLPTYMSMYFPTEGLIMAAGKLLLGHPWYGLLVMDALMCAALCWMLQAWLPPTWALLGGILAILRLGLFSYWINTYTGAGVITAFAGALVLGSLPRLLKTTRFREALLMGIGIALLATTRPYEGLLICLPVAFVLGRWIFFGKSRLRKNHLADHRPPVAVLVRRAVLPVALIVGALAWMGYYDAHAFGKATTLPYTVNRAAYAVAPYYVWQSQRPEPVYRHQAMRAFYTGNEIESSKKIHSPAGFVFQSILKVAVGTLFFASMALLPPLVMVRRVLLDQRTRFLVLAISFAIAGMAIQVFLIPHYLAPFTAIIYALGLQAMRHLRVWQSGGQPVGLTMVRLLVVVTLIMVGLRLSADRLHIFTLKEWPPSDWADNWYGPANFGTQRAQLQTQLESAPGKQLVIVRYTPKHNPLDEWVYNEADIDGSKVIWAREMDAANNAELIHYYKDRQVWLALPDTQPTRLFSYPSPDQVASASH